MGVANPPLEQWQIDHIRKMQEDLGMPSEERPVDETDYMDQTPDDEGAAYPATGGGLGAPDAYNAYQAAQKRVDAQIKANIDLLTDAQKRLRERRAGPSNAEKWFSIAAALGKPTRTGSFGESLGNLNEVLAKQNAMKREAQEERDALLEQYGMKIGGEQLRMLQSGATQAGQIYRAEMAAKNKDPYAGAVYDPDAKSWAFRPGSAAAPPVLSVEEVAKLAQDPKNIGMKFYTKDGRLREIQ
jgi:hypothetical protein